MVYGLLAGLGIGMATIVGSIAGFFVKRISHRFNDAVMGFAAGVMLAATFFGLILPAMDAGPLWMTIAGLGLGGLLISAMDKLVPHLHFVVGQDMQKVQIEGGARESAQHIDRVLLFILAIALHNLPEGLAVGIGYAAGNNANALMMTIGICVQNVPEGLIVVLPLVLAGVDKKRAFVIALITGLVEMLGTVIGLSVASLLSGVLPLLLAFAAGAMVYVVSDEIIPETHHGNEKLPTFALLAGIAVMMALQAAFSG